VLIKESVICTFAKAGACRFEVTLGEWLKQRSGPYCRNYRRIDFVGHISPLGTTKGYLIALHHNLLL
jgi:hypothetical protein